MSMNFFFKAFSAEQIEAMQKNPELVDTWILTDKQYIDETDVETAWDVLKTILDDQGFDFDTAFDNVLFNGAMLTTPASVARQSQALQNWTPERVRAAAADIDPESDLYHAEIWTDEDGLDDLQAIFERLQTFYADAARRDLGLVIYPA